MSDDEVGCRTHQSYPTLASCRDRCNSYLTVVLQILGAVVALVVLGFFLRFTLTNKSQTAPLAAVEAVKLFATVAAKTAASTSEALRQ